MERIGIFTVNEDGSVDVPAYLLEGMGYGPNEIPLMEVTEDSIIIHKKKPKAHKKLKPLKPKK